MSENATTNPTGDKKRVQLKETKSESMHEVSIQGKRVKYKTITQTIPLKDKFEEPRGAVFVVAYLRQPSETGKRPLMFVFNGGPGSGSVWLHLGAFGPVRVEWDKDGFASRPSY